MSGFGFEHIEPLFLAPLALLPLLRSVLRGAKIPSLLAAPADSPSAVAGSVIKLGGVVAIGASLLGAAGPHVAGAEIERFSEGAQIVMLIDRSGSMNETFAGRTPSGGEESKAAAARRILKRFVEARRHDLVGVAAFSTAPMLVTPISDHIGATEAAIDAIDRPGLDYTNIARGLAMALSMFKTSQADLSRAVLLISDGAGVIDPKLRDDLKAEFRKTNVSLYWLFLRTQGSGGISDQPAGDDESPQAAPERHLDLFFKSLGVPYQAFEAEGVEATEEALKQIDRLERHPVRYVEKLPRTDLSAWGFGLALAATLLLLAAKLAEVRLSVGDNAR
ncbi:VWA domain-containing protein [Methylocystis sp. FS]|uniref:vWA domain-containing protein n=1 Tax=Methylocystis silviterrae TaxID=2743612 RepID=UPI0015826C87|nr:vWA domain-containing protein [Methylocystis silviterrae]NUJ80161.1 VWA domain-containing protein [Methylocystis silviterrae]